MESEDHVSLTTHVLDVEKLTWLAQDDGAGAISTFIGVTRDTFEGRKVISLEYEGYDRMALQAMRSICTKARQRWDLKKIVIQHKLGSCPVGHASVFIAVSSSHRREAIAACEYTIDTLKASVPIWKKEMYVPDSSTVSGEASSDATWKKNKEFEPKVPNALISAARTPKTDISVDGKATGSVNTERADNTKAAVKRFKDKMRKSACNTSASGEGRSLLRQLDDMWSSDPAIDEIGFVMDPSPDASLLLMDHKLGLPMGLLKPLFSYCTITFQALCEEKFRREADGSMEPRGPAPGDDEDLQPRSLHLKDLNMHLLSVTRGILVVRGDMPTALNMRKKILLEMQSVSAADEELRLLEALFTLHPKSPSGWQHRRWAIRFRQCLRANNGAKISNSMVVDGMWTDSDGDTVFNTEQLSIELQLCDLVNRRYKQNYYGWMHRLWTLRQNLKNTNASKFLDEEIAYTGKWLLQNTSDHCAVNYYVQVIVSSLKVVSAEQGWKSLINQLRFSKKILVERPGSEALWLLRRSILQVLLETLRSSARLTVCGDAEAFEERVDGDDLFLRVVSVDAGDSDGNENDIAFKILEDLFELLAAEDGQSADEATTTALHEFLLSELRFVQRCSTDISVWGFQKQRTMALRFSLYAIKAVLLGVLNCLFQRNRQDFALRILRRRCLIAVAGVRSRLAQEDCDRYYNDL
jgi:molybdopterin synthase catalytic subunit